MTTAVRSAEAEDAQSPLWSTADDAATATGRVHPRRDRGGRGRRRHHSLPRPLLRAFEAAPTRAYVQRGVALRMEPFERRRSSGAAKEAAEGSRLLGNEARPARGWWSSTLELSTRQQQQQQQQEQQPFRRPLYGADIPEPLSSYERHVRRAIELHRSSSGVGGGGDAGGNLGRRQQLLRRYATLADLNDLEAVAAEVERRVNDEFDDSASNSHLATSLTLPLPQQQQHQQPLPLLQPRLGAAPPPPVSRPPPPPPVSRKPPPLAVYDARSGRLLPPRFTVFDSFEAIKRTIESQGGGGRRSAGSESASAAGDAEDGSRLLEANRWLLEAVATEDAAGSRGQRHHRFRRPPARFPPPPPPPLLVPPPVPLRRNRPLQQPPPLPHPPPPQSHRDGYGWLQHRWSSHGYGQGYDPGYGYGPGYAHAYGYGRPGYGYDYSPGYSYGYGERNGYAGHYEYSGGQAVTGDYEKESAV